MLKYSNERSIDRREKDKVSRQNKREIPLVLLLAVCVVAAALDRLQQPPAKPSDTPRPSAAVGSTQASTPDPVKKAQERPSTPGDADTNSGRRYLGRSQSGYELWADDDCIYVKGITEGDLARLGTDVWGFKKAVKAETGYGCVLYE